MDDSQKESAEKLIEYLDQGMSNEEIIKKIQFQVENMKLSFEEADEFLNFVRSKRKSKKELG